MMMMIFIYDDDDNIDNNDNDKHDVQVFWQISENTGNMLKCQKSEKLNSEHSVLHRSNLLNSTF